MKRTAFLRKRPDADYATVPVRKEPKPPKGPRPKKCANRACRAPYLPSVAQPFKNWCSDDCGTVLALEKLAKQKAKALRAERAVAKADRVATKAKLVEHKPLSYWLAKTERVCNEYIRARDPDVCISCGVRHSSAWQAGHYVSVGAICTLRFNEDNIHKQCIQCNMFEGSNAKMYRLGLIEKIGIARVEWLEGWHSTVKLTRAACEEIEAMYKAKLKALKNVAPAQQITFASDSRHQSIV